MRNVVLKNSLIFAYLILFASGLAAQSALVSGNQEIFGDYYSFLARIAAEQTGSQIEELKSYIDTHPGFERPYHQLLTLYLEQNQLNEAERYFKACTAQSQKTRNSLWALSAIAAARDSNDVAFRRLKNVLQTYPPSPYLLMEFAEYFRMIHLDTSFEDILNEMQLSTTHRSMSLAFYYSYVGNYELCRDYLNQIPQIDEFKLYALHMTAFSHQAQGNKSRAEALFRDGIAEAKKLGDEQFYIQNLISLAGLLINLQRKEASEYCQDALNRAQDIHDIDRMMSAHNLLSITYWNHRELDSALLHLRKAIDMASKQRHPRSLARLYLMLGQIQALMTNYAKAIEHYESSIEFSNQANDINLKISALRSKGDLYMELNLYDLASHEFTKAIQLADSSAYPLEYNRTLIDWAAQLYETHHFDKSRQLLTDAIRFGQWEPAELIYAHFHLATCYELSGNFSMALETYETVCQLVDEHFENTSTHYYKALALPQRALIETRVGNYSKADSLLAEPILHKFRQRSQALNIDYFSALANLRFNQDDFDDAIEQYKNAATLVDNYREKINVEHFRIGYYRQTSVVYRNLVLSLFERYQNRHNPSDLKELFIALQKCSGRSLQDLVPKSKNAEYPQSYINAVDSLQHLQRRLRDSVWKKESPLTRELRLQHDVARHALLNQRGLLIDEMSQSMVDEIVLDKLQKICLRNNLNVLFYHISDSISFSLVVQPDTLVLIPLDIDSDSLNSQIRTLMGPLHKATEQDLGSIKFHAHIAHDLYAALFRPIQEELSLSQNLFVLPGMQLLNLPFEMLLTQAPLSNVYTPKDSADYAPLFLQHHHTFTYSPTLAPLTESKNRTANSIIVFSNPTFYSSEVLASLGNMRSALRSIFMQLPNADVEAQRIAETTHADHIKGDRVTKDVVIKSMKKYDIVHIATHAFVDSVFDAYSGLALATTDSTDDGLLMGYELLDLSLNNDLIVLSACESGAGQFVAGEGVLGLPRLFLRAGARSVLMSLWKVHDPFPAHLMPAFYNAYKKQQKTKAEALALAKRRILSTPQTTQFNYKHPFFWATFCLYGSPGLIGTTRHPITWFGIGGVFLIAVATYTFYKQRRRSS